MGVDPRDFSPLTSPLPGTIPWLREDGRASLIICEFLLLTFNGRDLTLSDVDILPPF